ncbi:MAG: hypothetical protein FWC27_01535 [Firmicutes bacterium]|nr:hypothetical protein [Bacillota bacterium]
MKQLQRLFAMLSLIILVFSLTACDGKLAEIISAGITSTAVPSTSAAYVGVNVQEVVALLGEAGFKNITEAVVDDLITDALPADGEVEVVEIDGSSAFAQGDVFSRDVAVVVYYHDYATVPMAAESIVGMDCAQAVAALENVGFVNVNAVVSNTVLAEKLPENNTVELIDINGSSSFAQGDRFPKNAAIVIPYHVILLAPAAAGDYKGKNYADVIKDLADVGFVDIQTEVIDDLITGWLKKDGAVETVAIAGNAAFPKGTAFSRNAAIKVTFHTFSGASLKMQATAKRVIDSAKNAAAAVIGGAKNTVSKVSDGVGNLIEKVTAPKTPDAFEALLKGVTTQNIAALVGQLKMNVDFDAMLAELNRIKVQQSRIPGVMNDVRERIAHPEQLLGSTMTKHGELAEHMDVAAHNAERLANGLEPNAIIDDPVLVPRTGPIDYYIDGTAVQSKFYQSPKGTLDAVIKSIEDYPDIGKTGWEVIPKDQFEIFRTIRNHVDGGGKLADLDIEYSGSRMSLATLEKMYEQTQRIDSQTGRSFEDVVKPSRYQYDEVQLGKAEQTITNTEAELDAKINATKSSVIEKSIKNDFIEIGTAAAIGASVGSLVAVGFAIYEKVSAGKSIDNFTSADWKEVGMDALKGGAEGGGAAASTAILCIFGIPAPVAGAIVATIFQTVPLIAQYAQKKLALEDLMKQSLDTCITSSLLAAGAVVGQLVIPVPIVGAIVGSVATAAVVQVVKTYAPTMKELQKQAQAFADNFTKKYNALLTSTTAHLTAAKQTTQATLGMLYDKTKSCVGDAVDFAVVNAKKVVSVG